MFSDIPTTTQAIAKLKALRQGENEGILAYNQRYRILVERVEGRTIEQITSPVAMEMYLGTIIPPLRKSIKNSLFWNSKHAPRMVGEAMSKAQQLYVKHLILIQKHKGKDQPIAFASKSLTDAETRYANIERELLAIVFACQRFSTYLLGRSFVAESDHKPLEMIAMKNLANAPPRLQRMLLELQRYDVTIKYRPGKEMQLADATGDEQEDDQTKTGKEVVINEISRKFENRYRDRQSDSHDPLQNRRNNHAQEARTYETIWQSYNNLSNSHQPRYQETNGNRYAGDPTDIDVPTSRQGDQPDHMTRQEGAQSSSHRAVDSNDRSDTSTSRLNRQERIQNPVLRGSYTQIMVNPMQLTDVEFINWMEKLVEARKNRQEKKPHTYRNFRRSYNDFKTELKKPTLKNRLQPAQELDVQTIMSSFNCEYDDVVEAVDLYNLDVDECRTA